MKLRAHALLCVGWATFWASGAAAQSVTVKDGDWSASFEDPTDRYGHAIMGDLPEWGRLCLSGPPGAACVTLPRTSVFEDMAPRLHDVDGDGAPEAIVVESTFTAGAALVIYRLRGGDLERIATPPIGTRSRWLAPAAITDLDGDGLVELAYIDRPHLAKRLRVWRYVDGVLVHVADQPNLTNHKIGEPFISGGLRNCGAGPEIVTASGNWRELVATVLKDGALESRVLEPFSIAALQRVMACA